MHIENFNNSEKGAYNLWLSVRAAKPTQLED